MLFLEHSQITLRLMKQHTIHKIICLEAEWEYSEQNPKNRFSLNTLPMLNWLKEAYDCEVIYRRFVSVSGVTYCNINPESYLSNFRGQCYLFTLLFLCPLVRKEIPVGFDWSPVRHFSHPVEQVGEIFKEVDAMQPAGTCQ